jgi:hypothetical protein
LAELKPFLQIERIKRRKVRKAFRLFVWKARLLQIFGKCDEIKLFGARIYPVFFRQAQNISG